MTHKQIDYILTPCQSKSSINCYLHWSSLAAIHKNLLYTKERTENSDHELVMATMRLKLKKKNCRITTRHEFNLEKLRNKQVADLFKAVRQQSPAEN